MLQGHGGRRSGKAHGPLADKAQETVDVGAELRCTSFGWLASWTTSGDPLFGGRASLAYLQEHPEAEESTHVVM